MAHPMKGDVKDSINAKMRKMTGGYGSASGPANNKYAPDEKGKMEGQEDAVGFGADSSAPRARGDKPARRTIAANPVSTYRKGGAVKRREDGGPVGSTAPTPPPSPPPVLGRVAPNPNASYDPKTGKVKGMATGGAVNRADGGSVSAIEAANKDQAASNRARGGRAKGKHGTHVNVIVAPQGGGAGAPPMMPPHPMVPPMPPRPPLGASGPMVPPGGAGGPPGGPPPVMPPGMPPPGMMPPRASGGRVGSLADQGLSASGKPTTVKQISGKYDAGSVSGEGRLEKIANYGKKTANATPQKV